MTSSIVVQLRSPPPLADTNLGSKGLVRDSTLMSATSKYFSMPILLLVVEKHIGIVF